MAFWLVAAGGIQILRGGTITNFRATLGWPLQELLALASLRFWSEFYFGLSEKAEHRATDGAGQTNKNRSKAALFQGGQNFQHLHEGSNVSFLKSLTEIAE